MRGKGRKNFIFETFENVLLCEISSLLLWNPHLAHLHICQSIIFTTIQRTKQTKLTQQCVGREYPRECFAIITAREFERVGIDGTLLPFSPAYLNLHVTSALNIFIARVCRLWRGAFANRRLLIPRRTRGEGRDGEETNKEKKEKRNKL